MQEPKGICPLIEIIRFSELPIGTITTLPLFTIAPTQRDDNKGTTSTSPIEAFYEKGRILIRDGHHRYYDAQRNPILNQHFAVKKVENPYINY